MKLLGCDKLGKQYNHKWIFRKATLKLNQSDQVSLDGSNGTGKTTLLKLLTGIIKPSEGSLTLPDWNISIIGQSPMVYKHLTCFDNLRFFSSATDKEIKQELKNVQLLFHSNRVMAEFSKGMIQKTLIALAALRKPDFLFLDEPFTALDQQGAEYLKEKIASFKAKSIGFLLIDHNEKRLHELTSRHLHLKNHNLEEG